MIAGIGVDVVDVARFERQLERTPALLERLFAESERARKPHSLAGRFAAKEALIKALGGPAFVRWHDMRLEQDEDGKPSFACSGELARHLAERRLIIHVTMSHDAGIATAFVVVEAS